MTQDERIAALERHARAITDALTEATDHVRALEMVAAAMAARLDAADRVVVRDAALAAIGATDGRDGACQLVQALLPIPAGKEFGRGRMAPGRLQ